jgi:imidazolonepropionase-like amidohydrolase
MTPTHGFSAVAVLTLGAIAGATTAAAQTAASTPTLASAPTITAWVGGTVVSADGGPAIKNATVLISGERISQVGPASSIAIPSGAKIIPMTGKWLIPGLMNMHVHLGLKLPGAARRCAPGRSD